MQLRDGRILFSPSDLHRFIECEHLSRLMLLACQGELDITPIDGEAVRAVIAKMGATPRGVIERYNRITGVSA